MTRKRRSTTITIVCRRLKLRSKFLRTKASIPKISRKSVTLNTRKGARRCKKRGMRS